MHASIYSHTDASATSVMYVHLETAVVIIRPRALPDISLHRISGPAQKSSNRNDVFMAKITAQ